MSVILPSTRYSTFIVLPLFTDANGQAGSVA